MSSLDLIVIIVVGLFIVRGIWVGFIRQLASIIALILGFIIAGQYYDTTASFIHPLIKNQQLGFLITYGIIFILVFITIFFIGSGIRKVAQFALLGWFDKTLGGVFGAAKGVFLACLIFMGLAIFISGSNPLFRNSLLYPYLENTSIFILAAVKNKDVKKQMLPQQPAIANILADTVDLGKKIGHQAKEKAHDLHIID